MVPVRQSKPRACPVTGGRSRVSDVLRWAPLPALSVDLEGRILDANTALSKLLAISRASLLRHGIRDICAGPQQWDPVESQMTKAGRIADYHLHLRHSSGRQVECVLAGRTIQAGRESVRCFFLWDCSPCARRIQELEREKERHRLFAALEKDSLWISEFDADQVTRVVYMSEPIADLMGYAADEIKAMTLDQMIMPASTKGATASYIRQLRIDGRKGVDPARTWDLELQLRHKDGHPLWVETKSTFMRDKSGRPTGVIGFTRDISERRRYEAQLKALTARLVELQEVERRHIARELHDQIGQSLTGVRMLVGMLPERRRADLGQSIAQIQTLLDSMMTRVKDLSLQLRPSTLDDLGLLPTLLRHFATYKDQTKIGVLFKQRGLGPRLPAEVETAVFRIIQEGLTNVARHACTATAEVRVVVTGTRVKIEVGDKGKGFLPDSVFASGAASGIVGMKERATLLGGRLEVESMPGVGTRLLADIPLRNPRGTRGPG